MQIFANISSSIYLTVYIIRCCIIELPYIVQMIALTAQVVIISFCLVYCYSYGFMHVDQTFGVPSGDYSVGYVRYHTKKTKQHVMLFYPIKKVDGGFVEYDDRPPYKPWGCDTKADRHEFKALMWLR